jgi:hypothetical protein
VSLGWRVTCQAFAMSSVVIGFGLGFGGVLGYRTLRNN